MGEEKGQKYGFKESDFGKGCITKENGTIYMNYYNIENQPEQKDASAWHEAVHLTRYNKWKQYGEQKSMTQFTWKSINDRKSILSFRSNDFFEETYTTYSTMLFSPTSVRFNNGTNAEDLIGVKQYMVNKDKYKTLNYNGFRLSDGLNGTWLKSK